MMRDGADALEVPSSLRGYRYKPRAIAFQGWRAVGRWRVKCTAITVRGTAAHFPEVFEAAWSLAEALLHAVPDAGADAGIAVLTVHLGTGGVWLLLDWWEQGDMLMHRHFHSPIDDPTRFADVSGQHLGPCVWELAVQAHERHAWIKHVLANLAGPDLRAYLADGLSVEV